MRWAAIAVSPLVRLGDNQLPRLLSRTVPSKRVRASMSSSTTTAAARTAVDVVGVRNEMAWEDTEPCVAHFNAAGDSPMPRTVLERVQTHMQMEATLGGYEAAANVQDELEAVYDSAAKLINAQPDEIALQV